MARIRLLSENVANMIAAGEVVERPASVVKELVENSLDAQATRIQVDVSLGGRKIIRVVDDGIGMDRDDALLALERHATSKIASEADLFSVSSLGFRGEAIPAIASVSRFTLRTCLRGAQPGIRVRVEGGTVLDVVEEALPSGTEIEIADLFYNIPARRKFLKSPETEMTHVVEALTRLALVKPGVFFRLRQDEKTVLQVPETADIPQRIATLLGADTASALIPLDWSGPHVRLTGFISGPQTTRSSPGHFFVYCNGRFLRDRLLTHAVNTGYRGHVLKGRYPLVVLMIELPAELVDVNVHPTKSEVRFRQPSGVYEAIVSSIDKTLRERFGAPDSVFSILGTASALADTPATPASFEESYIQRVESAATSYLSAETQPLFGSTPIPSTSEFEVSLRKNEDESPAPPMPVDIPDLSGTFSSLTIVGQIFNNYIVCETRENGGTMVLIDAHAAHERILFENLRADYSASSIAVQAQLMPITLELRHVESAALLKILPALAGAGVVIEPFGGETFRILAIPAVLSSSEAEAVVRESIERTIETGQAADVHRMTDRFLSVVACHSAVRSGQELTLPQMREILRGLDRIKGPGSCPHGRPTFWSVPLFEIEKRFKRR